MPSILFIIIQVAIAFSIFIALNAIAIKLMKNDDIMDDVAKMVRKPIIKGYVETKGFTDKQYNTYNIFASNYRKLPVSVNKFGGLQFTYTVWVKFNNVSSENLANKVLFLRGDPRKYPYSVTEYGNSTKSTDYIIKCPLVRFGDDANTLIVEFNTTKHISETAVIKRIQNADETIRHNVFSLVPGKWMMMTFVFEDDKIYDSPENGINFKFYLNEMLYHTQRFKGALKSNQGDLCILPGPAILDGYLSDLTYYNYALNVSDIRRLVAEGNTPVRYNEMDDDPSFNQPLYLSQYNKLEINNF
jgi:hypothetical protein